MNNEPVAYIDPYDLERLPHYDCHIGSQQLKNGIPLYTHPAEHDLGIAEAIGFDKGYKAASVKELTDEEITACMGSLPKYNSEIVDEDLVKFARAILRKAQEK